jgi:hypothetical protein
MKFPITRENLQAFDSSKDLEELFEEEIKNQIQSLLDQVCKDFKRNMRANSREKKYVWRNLHLLGGIDNILLSLAGGISNTATDAIAKTRRPNIDRYIPPFIEKLKETFIDCDIIIDPLKTYLIIDWS